MEQERDQLLMSRAVDGDATTDQWDELTALAAKDPSVWRRLAETLRDHSGFARAVNAEVAVAETVPLPSPQRARAAVPPEPRTEPFAHASRWSGWTVAAAIVIAWLAWIFNVADTGRGVESPAPPVQVAGLPAADLLQAYLDRGKQEERVIGEVPDRILINSRPAVSGQGYELVYVRQILERAVVPDLYQFRGQDERGQPILVRYEDRPQGRDM
ncbi:MAG: hypothetical protein ACYTBR_10620 [Planctomycetota bacterium]|jgi:hypothetical protein